MKILQTEKKEHCVVETLIEVSREQYDEAAGKAFIKNKNKVMVPGFRRGKAPRRIVERMYGAEVFLNDTLEILYPSVLEAIKEGNDYKFIGQPQITDVDLKEGDGVLNLTVSFTFRPEVKIGEYKGLSVPKGSYEVPQGDVDAEIATVRVRNSRIESVDRPAQDGDITVIDFEGFIDGEPFDGGSGENFELELGSNTLIPGFEEKVCGMAVGEERDIDLVFPDDYEQSLAGKPVVFKVRLNEVKEKQLPELDDEFAMDVSEFDTLEEYKADIRDSLEKNRKAAVDDAFESAVMDKLIEDMEEDTPGVMVEAQMDSAVRNFYRQISSYNMNPAQYLQAMGTTPEMFREKTRENSEKKVKVALMLGKIAELENIEISDDDVEEEYNKAAAEIGKTVDELKKALEREELTDDLKIRAAHKLVMESAIALDPEAAQEDEAEKPAAKKSAPKKTAPKQSTKTKEQTAADGEPAESGSVDGGSTDEEPSDAETKAPAKKPRAKKAVKGDDE